MNRRSKFYTHNSGLGLARQMELSGSAWLARLHLHGQCETIEFFICKPWHNRTKCTVGEYVLLHVNKYIQCDTQCL